jgi:hypothetical protein
MGQLQIVSFLQCTVLLLIMALFKVHIPFLRQPSSSHADYYWCCDRAQQVQNEQLADASPGRELHQQIAVISFGPLSARTSSLGSLKGAASLPSCLTNQRIDRTR